MRANLTTLIVLLALIQVSAASFAQKVTLKENNISIEKVFREIRKQTGLGVFFEKPDFDKARKIQVAFNNTPLDQVMEKLLSGTQMGYVIEDKIIIVTPKDKSFLDRLIERFQNIDVQGKLIEENGQAIAGATIKVKGTTVTAVSDGNGFFSLKNVSENAVLEISYIGYQTIEIKATKDLGEIKLAVEVGKLEEITVNAGYYKVKERELTGSISKITAKEIGQQPVANPLATMQGRMAGVHITQSSGTPGGGFDIQIRGRNSLRTEGNAPLYIVDGIPYVAQSASDINISATLFPAGNVSPLNSINPNDIESIEVLKDADATAIYGSRGSNGVVLITTKKGGSDKTAFSLQSTTSVSAIAKVMELMNTQQYLQMRRDAYLNDGITVIPSNAYDINGIWDENRYTDWQKEFIGGEAISQNTYFSIAGGSGQTSYLISAAHRNDGTVFPGDFEYKRTNFMMNINHRSKDERFVIQSNIQKSSQRNNLMAADFTSQIFTSPNAPELYNESGKLNWENNTFENPLAKLESQYLSETDNLTGQLNLDFLAMQNLKFSLSGGFTNSFTDETATVPSTVYSPALNATSEHSAMTNSTMKRDGWIVEPKVNWWLKKERHQLDLLLGATFENRDQQGFSMQAGNFTSNDLIMNRANAAIQNVMYDNETMYRYAAMFGRLNYSLDQKYFVNLTGRRDGSSRFGVNNRFANFGAIGAAWLFSREKSLENSSWLSFGKLRASYGIAGSDLIGDYQYLNSYGINAYKYNGIPGLEPLRLYNPDFSWETNKKLEAALELEFFKGRVAPSISWYRNRSSNQLVGIPLPGTTGFASVQSNLNATVENSGWEFTLRTINIDRKDLQWSMNLNMSIPRSRLLAFPNLDGSTYASRYVVGEPTTIRKVYRFMGINQETGLYTVEDMNGDGVISQLDRQQVVNVGVRSYGGLSSSLVYKNWSFDFLIQWVNQQINNFDYTSSYLGIMSNKTTAHVDYFSATNPNASYQSPTAGSNNRALQTSDYFRNSNAVVADGSFVRLKSLQFQYKLNTKWLKSTSQTISLQGFNLLTLTGYRWGDPETAGGYLPAMRTVALGFSLNF